MKSRVKRNSKINRMKRKILKSKLWKVLLKKIIRNVVYLIVGFVYASYLLIRAFDNLIIKIFSKLPRTIKVVIIYLLVANTLLNAITTYNKFSHKEETNKVLNQVEKVVDEIKEIETTEVKAEEKEIFETVEENKEICIYDNTSCLIITKAKELGMNEEQALISVAIAKWETGNYTSVAFNEKNNVGGMMCKSGLIVYNNLEDGIVAFVSNLKNHYFDMGLDTLEKIQPKYCPIGAKNDPQNLNIHWLNGTNAKLNELKNAK